MSSNLDRWTRELNRISNAKNDIANAIRNKGVDLSASVKFSEYPGIINNIKTYDPSYTIQAFNGDQLVGSMYSPTGQCDYVMSGYTGNITNIIIGDNVTSMSSVFCECTNLTGSPVYSPNVINMNDAYRNCYNLSFTEFTCPNTVEHISGCFYGLNIGGNHYYNNCTNLISADDVYGYDTRQDCPRLNIFTNALTQNLFFNEYHGLWVEEIYETIPENYNYCYCISAYNIYVYTEEIQDLTDAEDPDPGDDW